MHAEISHTELNVASMTSPIGDIMFAHDVDATLYAADFADCEMRFLKGLQRRFGNLHLKSVVKGPDKAVKVAFEAYFAGEFSVMDLLQLRMNGTAFQNVMWSALRKLPAGETMAYSTFAERLGRPTAARAIGHANGANPFNIVVPCHRLLGANGNLTGYAGGLHRKRWLIDHEAKALL